MTRWDRRDAKRKPKMRVDGRRIGEVYANAIAKHAKEKKS